MKCKEKQDTDLFHKAFIFHLRDLTGNRKRLVLSVGTFQQATWIVLFRLEKIGNGLKMTTNKFYSVITVIQELSKIMKNHFDQPM